MENTFLYYVMALLLQSSTAARLLASVTPAMVVVQLPWPNKVQSSPDVCYRIYFRPGETPDITPLLQNFFRIPRSVKTEEVEELWEKACPSAFTDIVDLIMYVQMVLGFETATASASSPMMIN